MIWYTDLIFQICLVGATTKLMIKTMETSSIFEMNTSSYDLKLRNFRFDFLKIVYTLFDMKVIRWYIRPINKKRCFGQSFKKEYEFHLHIFFISWLSLDRNFETIINTHIIIIIHNSKRIESDPIYSKFDDYYLRG